MADPEALELSGTVVENVNHAFASGKPIVVAYVDGDGQPQISFRGSTQVFSPDQLAIWVRDPEGGLLANVEENPRMALMYFDHDSRTVYLFAGRGRVDDGEETRHTVYENADPRERDRDPERRGKPLIVDLDTVQTLESGERHLMKRA